MAAPTQKPQGRKPRKAQISQSAPKEERARPFFVLLAQGTSIATETPGRARDLSHHGLHHVRQSGDPEKAGMDVGAVFVATCLAAAAGSIIMGLYANYPIALCGNARRSPPHLHHDGLYRELGRRR